MVSVYQYIILYEIPPWMCLRWLDFQELNTHDTNIKRYALIDWEWYMRLLIHAANLVSRRKYDFIMVIIGRYGIADFPELKLTLILTWRRNYIHYKVWDEIAYPFSEAAVLLTFRNVLGISSTFYWAYDCAIHVGKRGPWWQLGAKRAAITIVIW